MRECLNSIRSYSYDLFVTLPTETWELNAEITQFFPRAKVEVVENRGYDVAPFVHVLNQVNLEKYQYIVKIHTKKNIHEGVTLNGFLVSGTRWRNFLLRFLENERTFQKCMGSFEKDRSLGMICDFRLIMTLTSDNARLQALVWDWARKMGVSLNGGERFVAGTMFIARANLFEKFKRLNLRMSDFEAGRVVNELGLAHVMERILGVVVCSQAFTIRDCFTPEWVKWGSKVSSFCLKKGRRFIRNKVTRSGH